MSGVTGAKVRLGMVWAEAHGGVIGAAGGMPWHVPEDLAHFKEITAGAPVVMGRRTWESLPERFRPLPDRENIVLTTQKDWSAPGAVAVDSRVGALSRVSDGGVPQSVRRAWVIGGAQVFERFMFFADRLEVTELDLDVAGDTHAPSREGWRLVDEGEWQTSRTGVRYRFLGYER